MHRELHTFMLIMTHNRALASMHVAALMFGLTGIFGKLAEAGPLAIVLGRAFFAVLALLIFARLFSRPLMRGITRMRLFQLAACGILLGIHWLTFFHAVKSPALVSPPWALPAFLPLL